MFIPFGEFAPDQAILGSKNAAYIRNAYPITDRSYGPARDLSTITNALNARCQGAISVRASDGTIHVFAGDATKLYKLNSDGVTWNDVSKVGGYTTGADGNWRFVQIGNRIIATNYADNIQTYVIGSSALFADLSAGAPKARYLAVIKGFLVAADTWDAVGGYVQQRVWWADRNDPTNWPTPGTAAAAAAQSDYQDVQFGGGIQGIIGGCGGQDGVVFLQNAIVNMNYIGGGVVFSFTDAERGRGAAIPNSIINIGPFAGYISETGFCLYNGAGSIPIGAGKVDKLFWEGSPDPRFSGIQIEQTGFAYVCVGHDQKNKIVIWGYPFSSLSGVSGFLAYNYQFDRWSFVQSSGIEFIFSGYTAGYTLEGLDAVSTSIDALPFSLDSSAWMGGRPLFAGFATTHKFGYFNGSNLLAAFSTGEFSGPDESRIFIRSVRPITDIAPTTFNGGITSDVEIRYRANQNAAPSSFVCSSMGADGKVHCRVDTRYAAVYVILGAGQTWYHAQGVDVDYIPSGAR